MPPPHPPRHDVKASAALKEENVYIPSFISKRPFYAGDEGGDNDYLQHQRLQKQETPDQWYDRGKKTGPAATKFRKGACDNCGAITHVAKDCLSRPRLKGARYTGKDIQADEVIKDIKLGWDAKRDRWNGYDSREFMSVVDDYNQLEDLRKLAQKRAKVNGDDDENDAGDKYAEENDMSKHQSTATRQLRIREDTAKYLLNLDLDSAKYDPKTRALVDPGATVDQASELFAEEKFMRASGDAVDFRQAQRYAWEAQELAGDTTLHLQANPTAGEFYRKKRLEESQQKVMERERRLREQYGDQNGHVARIEPVKMTESEVFVEYDEHGAIKGRPKALAKSKYPEDVLINNHSTVWGSWWHDFQWGYQCCYSFIKNSYCTGEDGKMGWAGTQQQRTGIGLLEGIPDIQPDSQVIIEGSAERKPSPQPVGS